MMKTLEARDDSKRLLTHDNPPMTAVKRQPSLFTNALVKGPRANVNAIPIEPIQAGE